ncbi:TPA: hypothetical protein JIR14_20205 [Acinetobacter baumannii]|nr:hypothetical protein [Acinetobacter baumannii]HAV4467256.1 hypothetical protein [Acinetobacter baumannii]
MILRKKAVLHPSLREAFSGDKLLIIEEMFAAFEEYWLSGYLYEFGLDAPLDDPAAARASGLCHVHVLYNDDLFTDADFKAWEKQNKPSIPPILRATRWNCDSMVIYSVSREGTALFLMFYPNNGHARIRKGTLELAALAEASEAYFYSVGENPASYEEVRKLLQSI